MQELDYFGLYNAKQITGQTVQSLLLGGKKEMSSPFWHLLNLLNAENFP